jgi:hypothetical protein
MTFEQLIIQDGFMAVNFDLWLLLVKYEVPSIFISSKNIPETRYNLKEFVCYTDDHTTNYAIIVTPAMYKRTGKDITIYRVVINEENNYKIDLNKLPKSECLINLENAIDQYISVEDYLDVVFEKDVTTRYKPKQKGFRNIEFEIQEEEPNPIPEVAIAEEEKIEIEPVKKPRAKKVKAKKIEATIVLEEEPEEPHVEPAVEIHVEPAVETHVEPHADVNFENILNPVEQLEIIPVKKRKTRKQREKKVKVNPPGKKNSRKKLPENFEIVEEVVEDP